jgi:hypothetical protein
MPRAAKTDIASLVAKHLRSLELGKRNYRKADAALDEIEQKLQPGEVVELPNGRKVRFKDKFDGRNRINVGLNARRFEFEEVTSP